MACITKYIQNLRQWMQRLECLSSECSWALHYARSFRSSIVSRLTSTSTRSTLRTTQLKMRFVIYSEIACLRVRNCHRLLHIHQSIDRIQHSFHNQRVRTEVPTIIGLIHKKKKFTWYSRIPSSHISLPVDIRVFCKWLWEASFPLEDQTMSDVWCKLAPAQNLIDHMPCPTKLTPLFCTHFMSLLQ